MTPLTTIEAAGDQAVRRPRSRTATVLLVAAAALALVTLGVLNLQGNRVSWLVSCAVLPSAFVGNLLLGGHQTVSCYFRGEEADEADEDVEWLDI
jgi:hypothetical protein